MPCSEIGPMTCDIRVLCLPYHNTGAHFIDWSIHYVCNQIGTYTRARSEVNWHQHKCHHVRSYQALVATIKSLYEHPTSQNFETIYFSKAPTVDILRLNHDVTIEMATSDQIAQAEHEVAQDYQQGVSYCQDHDLIPVFFDYCHSDFGSIFYNDRYPLDWYGVADTKINIIDKWNHTFFSESVSKFDGEIWDKRELAALTYQAPKALSLDISDLIDQTRPHLYYTTDDVWNGFDRCLEEICYSWKLKINADSWQTWKEIYNDWRTVHDPYFARHLPRIVDAVVNNKYLSLRRFRMNFFMEIMLQHELIVKHGLNIKTWQLEHFPDNTQDLYALLEPNFHHL